MTDTTQKTNPVLRETVKACEEAARKNDAAVWQRVADELAASTRQMREVTLSDIERNTEDGDTVVVPGKVIGSGRFDRDVTVAAMDFSRGAMDAIDESGEVTYIDALVEETPEGSEVVLLG